MYFLFKPYGYYNDKKGYLVSIHFSNAKYANFTDECNTLREQQCIAHFQMLVVYQNFGCQTALLNVLQVDVNELLQLKHQKSWFNLSCTNFTKQVKKRRK